MNFRQVHLDFHTSEKITGIGSAFSPEQFQKALKTGHVNSITVFSKCHHGWAYHPSKANEMHPGLDFDLLGAQIKAAHEIGVKTPVYLSAGLDEKMAGRHPEWLVRGKDQRTTWVPDFSQPGYHKFCMNTPYLDYLLAQIEEVCENYDADGIFLDIVGVQPCYCTNCIRTMEEMGLDPFEDKNALMLAEKTYANYSKRVREAIDKHKPGLPVFHNGGHIRQGRRDLAYMNSHLEIESLPTGGWGYDHFPLAARYSQNLGMEYLGMTGKFHTSWGEFGGFKHPNALRYEVALAAANGAKSSVGDQLAPDGEMDMVTYELIGAGYAQLEEKEPWLDHVESVADVAFLSYESAFNLFGTDQTATTNDIDKGVARILLEGHYLYDVIDEQCDFGKYKVIILPDKILYQEEIYRKIREFLAQGGKILATGKSGLNEEQDTFAFDFGGRYEGTSEYKPSYFRPTVSMPGLGDTGYIFYTDVEKVVPEGGEELARFEEAYFNRTREHFCSHRHAPNSKKYGGSGMIEGEDGIYIPWQVFTDYATIGSLAVKQAVLFALDRLLGERKTLRTSLPVQGVVTLMKQQDRLVTHLLYAVPVKRGSGIEIIEDIVPVYQIHLEIKTGFEPKRVYLAPQEKDLEYTYEEGNLTVTVPEVYIHQMVVIE